MKYEKDSDTLSIFFNHPIGETYKLEAGDMAVYLDDGDGLTEIIIKNASQFIARALAAGVVVDKNVTTPKTADKPVWEEVDSSMISAFKYDASSQTLTVMFNRTGTYDYFDVPAHIVAALRQASSKGSYMKSMIIDNYHYAKASRQKKR